MSMSHLYNKDTLLPDEVMDNGRVDEHTDVEDHFSSESPCAGGDILVHVSTEMGAVALQDCNTLHRSHNKFANTSSACQ